MLRPWAGYWVGAGAMIIAAASCTQDFDEFFQGPETVTQTTSGTGGTTTTTTTQGGGGSTGECDAPDECSGISTTCRYKTCDNHVCDWASADAGTTCTEAPGQNVCNGSGTCVECTDPVDCPNATDLCVSSECVPPHCTDLETNEGETDVDCGGNDCPACADDLACLVFSDCVSQFCDNETCAPCGDDGDCTDATGTWCDPTANDANGGCIDQSGNGVGCTGGNQCTSTNCVDGACCVDEDCAGACNSCNKPGSEGTCTQLDENASCSDGQYCNGTETCNAGGTCISSGNPCTGDGVGPNCDDACDEGADACTGNDADTVDCDDGLYCNGDDTCDGGGTCEHAGDPCPARDPSLDDCTQTCTEASGGSCTGNDAQDDPCDDGTYCNGADTCNASGVCTNTGTDPCAGNYGDCDDNCSESCNESAGDCTADDPDTARCDKNSNCQGGAYDGMCNGSGSCI